LGPIGNPARISRLARELDLRMTDGAWFMIDPFDGNG
jgi:hypothetical protein